MRRRDLLGALAATAFPGALLEAAADFTLEIGPVSVELAPGTIVKTLGYNGSAPGPLLRIPEGKTVSIEVHNNTPEEEVVHWHGLHIPSDVDGSLEEGTPGVPPRGRRRYSFTATPSGTR
ncbi:MAG: multicopper oxidase domain-containing protein, partial [Terriglobales bacterium]